MKVNRKYLPKIPSQSEYLKYTQSLFNCARLQNELIPFSLGFNVNICEHMIEMQVKGKHPFYQGASCGQDLAMDTLFAESLASELHEYLKSR
mgnify:CR=1 FL=1